MIRPLAVRPRVNAAAHRLKAARPVHQVRAIQAGRAAVRATNPLPVLAAPGSRKIPTARSEIVAFRANRRSTELAAEFELFKPNL